MFYYLQHLRICPSLHKSPWPEQKLPPPISLELGPGALRQGLSHSRAGREACRAGTRREHHHHPWSKMQTKPKSFIVS